MRKTLVITGASAGIGLSIAEYFLSQGFDVVNLSRSKPDLEGVKHFSVDLSEQEELERILPELKSYLSGENQITLIHNAFSYCADSVSEFDKELVDKSFQVALLAPMKLNQALLPLMSSGSSILFIGSTLSEKAVSGAMSYSTLKHATIGLMRSVAQDLISYDRIHTVCLCPGFTRTKMLEDHLKRQNALDTVTEKVLFKRLLEPEEIAKLTFFCSGNPSINGSVIHANLGQLES